MAEATRLLGIDVGEKRIGLAVGDPTGLIASALGAQPSVGRARDVAAIAEIAREQGASAIVVGMPVSLSGHHGPQAEKVRRFGEALREAVDVEVIYWDERLTTTEAARYLRDAGMRRQKRRENIDAAAAAVMLQSYLDYLRNR